MFQRVQNRVMLRSVRNQMTATREWTARQAKHGEIAGLGPATCKNYFVRLRAKQPGETIARVIDRRACLTSGRVHARRISEMSIQVRQHRRARWLAKRCGRVVIEINHRASI